VLFGCEDKIDCGEMECEVVDWIQLAQVRASSRFHEYIDGLSGLHERYEFLHHMNNCELLKYSLLS
jgi:hypothetical protein